MRTTLDIEPGLLDQVVKETGEKTKSRAVNKALEQYIRRLKLARLQAMAGKIHLDHVSEEHKPADLKRWDFLEKLRGE